jgi:hypothetical protein
VKEMSRGRIKNQSKEEFHRIQKWQEEGGRSQQAAFQMSG